MIYDIWSWFIAYLPQVIGAAMAVIVVSAVVLVLSWILVQVVQHGDV